MEKTVYVLLRAAFVYCFFLVLIRLSGKRTVQEGTPFDFVVALILSDLPDDAIWGEIPLARFITAAAILVAVHLTVTLLASRYARIDQFVNGRPSELIKASALRHKGMAREHINEGDLDALLRECQVDERAEVRQATLELSGALGVQLYEEAKPAQKKDKTQLLELLS